MNATIWKAYKTEAGAIKYINKISAQGVRDAAVEFIGGLYLVVSN